MLTDVRRKNVATRPRREKEKEKEKEEKKRGKVEKETRLSGHFSNLTVLSYTYNGNAKCFYSCLFDNGKVGTLLHKV